MDGLDRRPPRVRFQFQIDGRGLGCPIHAEWSLAARDAVAAGYAIWISPTAVRIDWQHGGDIARIYS